MSDRDCQGDELPEHLHDWVDSFVIYFAVPNFKVVEERRIDQYITRSSMTQSALEQYYTTIYSQAFSPCGKYVAAASSFGKIAIFNLCSLLNSDLELDVGQDMANIQSPIFSFKADDGPIFALVSTKEHLVGGGIHSIRGWLWKDLLSKNAKIAWALTIPKGNDYTRPEVNAMALMEKDGSMELYAGCGDNNVYVFDLENQKLKCTLSGHTNYVHCLALCSEEKGGICWSGGEDGSVLAWDLRAIREPVHRIEPYKNEFCRRPNFGKWIGCIAIDGNDDWMVCGGGPCLSMWHLRSLACNVTFPIPNSSQSCVLFHEDLVIAAGSEPFVYRWSFNGQQEGEMPTTPFSMYSLIQYCEREKKVLSIAGSGTVIDVSTNFKYKDFSLNFQ